MIDKADRIKILENQHQALEKSLAHTLKTRENNDHVNFIKKSKLLIKDKINRLQMEIKND